jgi:tetratricopeptide (TPR) repeat protein
VSGGEDDAFERALRLYDEARDLVRRGERDEAIDCFRRSIAAHPHFKACELLGELLLATGRPQDACVFLAASVALGTRNFRGLFLLARALLVLGEREMAVARLRQALELQPTYKEAATLLASLEVDANGPTGETG